MSNRDDWSELINEVLDAYAIPTTIRMRVWPAGAPTAKSFKQRMMAELHNAFVAGQESQKVWCVREADEEFYENQARGFLSSLSDLKPAYDSIKSLGGDPVVGLELLMDMLKAAHNRGFEQGRKLIIRHVERTPFHIAPEEDPSES